jgi:hypothetical protein
VDDPLLAPIEGAHRHEVGGLVIDMLKVGNSRIKRTVYPPGWRWSTHMRPVSGTDHCMHTHVGFLARGHITGVYDDGCTYEYKAPAFAVVAAGHDAWVIGEEPAVFIQVDSEEGTARRFGLPERHAHA